MSLIISIAFFLIDINTPEKIQVEIIGDNFGTNILIVANIVVSLIVAYFIKDRIEKKAKQYEVNAFIQKLKAKKIISFCIKANSIFSEICVKNPISDPINNEDICKLDKLVISKHLIFLDNKSIANLRNFRDYIIEVMDDPSKKSLFKEKSFFFLIKKTINYENNGR